MKKQIGIDQTLLLRALIEGKCRYERWDDGRGEVCVNGLRHVIYNDADGIPLLTDNVRKSLFLEVAK